MRERPKLASYLERHRQAEEIQTKGYSSSEASKVIRFPGSAASLRLAPNAIPKKNEKGAAMTVSRVRVGSSRVTEKSPSLQTSACPGKMTQFKNFDDIPDGLPMSPQHIRETPRVVVDDESMGDDDAEHDYYRHYNVPPTKQPLERQPLPFEVETHFREESDYQKSGSRPRSEQLSKYPPLQADRGMITQPIVYSSDHIKSAHEFHRDFDDDDYDYEVDDDEKSWGNCSDDDSEPYHQSSHIMMNNYDSVETKTLPNRDTQHKREQTIPPDLPYESSQEHRRGSKDKVYVKEQLYFSKQPRQIDYTPYTLGQYRQSNPKEYVEIVPHIKPDLNTDILKAKRANAERIKDFSKQLQDFNKVSLSEQRRLPQSSESSDVQLCKRRLESNRERAIQFSRGIPKPVNKSKNDSAERKSGEEDEVEERFAKNSNHDEWGLSDVKAAKLHELQLKHLESKKNIEAMRKTMGM